MKKYAYGLCIKLLILLLVCATAFQTVSAQHEAAVDSIFAEWDNPDTPGAAVGVIKDGELIYSAGYGMADLEHDIPITPSTPFYIASLSKQFFAFSALLLEEQGKLDLDAPIQEYLPDFPTYETHITTRHMIHHMSGLRDYQDLIRLRGRSTLDHYTMLQAYELVKNQKELNFLPGEEYLYNNSGYLLLALIIEEVSGMSFKEFAKVNIFDPLGMDNTLVYDDITGQIPNRAFSYEVQGDRFLNVTSRFDLYGSGGIYSTIKDLYKWDQNFYDNVLGKGGPSIIDSMKQVGVLNNGDSLDYAFGLGISSYRGLNRVTHGGAFAGFRHYYMRFPEQQFSVIMLANRGDASRPGKTLTVTDLLLRDEFLSRGEESITKPKTNPHAYDEKLEISALKGRYLVNDSYRFNFYIEDGDLYLDNPAGKPFKMVRKRANVFYAESIPDTDGITFYDPVQGKTQKLVFRDLKGTRTEFTLDPDDLPDFVGRYWSDELKIEYHLYMQDEALMYKIGFQQAKPMIHVDTNLFTSDWPSFQFSRDSKGNITGFRLSLVRTRDVWFQKQSIGSN